MTVTESLRECVAIVIPAYNEALAIREVLERGLATGFLVIVVDDGSTDETASIACELPVEFLRHARNRGKGAALMTGVTHALACGATHVVTLDGDGQHRPEDVVRLVTAARIAGGLVIGSRRADRAKAPPIRYFANRVADFWISWAAGRPLDDTQSWFRLYPSGVLQELLIRCVRTRGFAFESAALIEAARCGVPIASVAIPALYHGKRMRPSHFRPARDTARIALMVAVKLIRWGLYPAGLVRALAARRTATLGHPAVYRDDLP